VQLTAGGPSCWGFADAENPLFLKEKHSNVLPEVVQCVERVR